MNNLFKESAAARNARIILKAYAYNHLGEIISKGVRMQVSLIDITPGGARLMMQDKSAPPPEVGDTFACNIRLDDLSLESGEIPCEATWCDGREFGVRFIKTLETTVSDLQRQLDRKAS